MKGRLYSKFLSDLVTIYRKEAQQDEFGGEKSGWVRKYWEVKARIYGASGGYKITVDGNEYGITHKGIMNRDTDVVAGDKITNYDTGFSYVVLRVYVLKQTKKTHHIELLLSGIQE